MKREHIRLASSPHLESSGSHNSGVISGIHLPLDEDGGIDLRQLRPGIALEIQTKNTTYTAVLQPGGDVLLCGHPEYCPEPRLITGLGGAYRTGLFREGYLAPGMRLNFPNDGRRVSTSSILSITRIPTPRKH